MCEDYQPTNDVSQFYIDSTFFMRKNKPNHKKEGKKWKCFEAVNMPGSFISVGEDNHLQIMSCLEEEEEAVEPSRFCFKMKKAIKKKVLKEKHEKGLTDDKSIWSTCHTYEARMQGDGNFVLYKWTDGEQAPIWASNTCGTGEGPFRLNMQGDGNLVVYDSNNAPTWASNTCGTG